MRLGLTSIFSPRPATSRLAKYPFMPIGTELSLDRPFLGPLTFDKHNSRRAVAPGCFRMRHWVFGGTGPRIA
jgi:hypothetical protein